MKFKVEYLTEFGIKETKLNLDEIVSFTHQFKLIGIEVSKDESDIKSTDDLIDEIKKIGVSLPTINYEYGGFESIVWDNQKLAGQTRGIEVPDTHSSFRDACLRVIDGYNK